MTPQSTLHGPRAGRPAARGRSCARLLDSMNERPGTPDPTTRVVPFARLRHAARGAPASSSTTDTHERRCASTASSRGRYPLYLAFLGDVDGDGGRVPRRGRAGRARGPASLFSCCEGSARRRRSRRVDARARRAVLGQLRQLAAAVPVQQVREEAALRDALDAHIRAATRQLGAARRARSTRELAAAVRQAGPRAASRCRPDGRRRSAGGCATCCTSSACRCCSCSLSPLLLVLAVLSPLVRLRRLEKTDPELCPRTDPRTSAELPRLEDHDVTNQFTRPGQPEARARRGCGSRASCCSSIDYFGAARLHARAPGARAHDPLRALGVPRRPPARHLPEQLRRQPRELHGRLHQQGRLRLEPRLQQRDRLPARELAGSRRLRRTSTSSRSTCAATRCRRRSGTRPTRA